jgi:hypothetical protein
VSKNSGGDREPSTEENADDSSVYIQDKETGQWKVRNPSGSIGYNYLYRDDWGWLDS